MALVRFLENHPNTDRFLICTDNDAAGERLADRIAALTAIACERAYPPFGKDWNDSLQAVTGNRSIAPEHPVPAHVR